MKDPKGPKPKAQIASKRIYSGKVLNLDLDTVRFPDDSTGELEIIRHSGASAVVPFLSDPAGEDPVVLLMKQFRYAADDFLYEIPAGRLDEGEEPESCARRELKEETGCDAERFEHLLTFYTTPGFIDEKIHVYLATGIVAGDAARETDEFLEPAPMSLSRALQLIRDGEIKDGKTIVALLFAAGYRSGR